MSRVGRRWLSGLLLLLLLGMAWVSSPRMQMICVAVNLTLLIRILWVVVVAHIHAHDTMLTSLACSNDSYQHVVIIPIAKEKQETICKLLCSLSRQRACGPILVALTFEHFRETKEEDAKCIKDWYSNFVQAEENEHGCKQFEVRRYTHVLAEGNEAPGRGSNFKSAAKKLQHQFECDAKRKQARKTLTIADADTEFHPQYFQDFENRLEEEDPDLVFFVASRVYGVSDLSPWMHFAIMARSLVTASLDVRYGLAPSLTTGDISMTWALASSIGFCDPKAVGDDLNLMYRALRKTSGRLRVRSSRVPVSIGSPSDFIGLWKQELRWIRVVFEQVPELRQQAEGLPSLALILLYIRVLWSSTLDRFSILLLGLTCYVLGWTWVLPTSVVVLAAVATTFWVHGKRAEQMHFRAGSSWTDPRTWLGIVFFAFFELFCFLKALWLEIRGEGMKFEPSCTQGFICCN